MRKKIVILALGLCLLAAACAGKGQKKDETDKNIEEAAGEKEKEEQKKDNKIKKQEETQKEEEVSKDKKKDKY